MRKIVVLIIKGYQMISSLFPPSCRFVPSCSEYTRQAVLKYGVIKGVLVGGKRLIRCHPFHPGGYDPI